MTNIVDLNNTSDERVKVIECSCEAPFSSSRSRRRERRKEIRNQNGDSEVSKQRMHPPRNGSGGKYKGKTIAKNTKKNKFSKLPKLPKGKPIHKKSQDQLTGEEKDKNKNKILSSITDEHSLDSSATVSTCSLSSSDLSDAAPPKDQHNKELKQTKKQGKKKRKRRKRSKKVPENVKQKYIALDCEMVGIGNNGMESAVARVSIVNFDGNIMLDTYVRVPVEVTDFRTAVSGIRQDDIDSDEAMDLDDCREIVRDIISDRILVGHGLKNDLQALGLSHPWHQLRDTAKYDHFMREHKSAYGVLLPRKLKELARDFLGIDIQMEGMEHDSVVDAWVAMSLYKTVRQTWDKTMEWKYNKTREIENNRNNMDVRVDISDSLSVDSLSSPISESSKSIDDVQE